MTCFGADFRDGQFTDCSFSAAEMVSEDDVKQVRHADLREIKWNENTNFRGTRVDTIDPSKHQTLMAFIAGQQKSDQLFTHEAVLEIVQRVGTAMERHPRTYRHKDEETLRDHLLTALATHFPSVTAETFNQRGKIDILIRQENRNIFVGECKFWRGVKAHLETIEQLLSYLTWREPNAAIIYFVRNRELNPVLTALGVATPSHRCYMESLGKTLDSWLNFRFTLLADSSRFINLSILVFHFPA